MEIDEEVYVIPTVNDKKLGFLAIESNHDFIIDDKIWYSALHYVTAHKFEDEEFMEKIRQSRTLKALKIIMFPRQMYTEEGTKITGYGNKYVNMRLDWNSVKKDVYFRALKYKFDQNTHIKSRLIETDGIHIDHPEYGKILENLRSSYIREKMGNRSVYDPHISPPEIDIKLSKLSVSEIKFVENLMRIANIIMKEEYCNKLYFGMIEDTICNILHPDPSEKILNMIKSWAFSLDLSFISIKLPNYNVLMKEVEIKLGDGFITKAELLRSVYIISSLIRWLRLDCPKDKFSEILNKSKTLKRENIILTPKQRQYRGLSLPMNLRSGGMLKKKNIYEFEGLTIVKSGSDIVISGPSLSKIDSHLIAKGGNVLKKDKIVFKSKYLDVVEKIIYEEFSKTHDTAHTIWLTRKITQLHDFSKRITKVVGETQSKVNILKMIMESILKFKTGKELPNLTEKIKKIAENLGFTTEEAVYLSQDIPNQGYLKPLISDKILDLEDYEHHLDKQNEWQTLKFEKKSHYILSSIKTIYEELKINENFAKDKLFAWIFTTLSPNYLRKSVDKFLKSTLNIPKKISERIVRFFPDISPSDKKILEGCIYFYDINHHSYRNIKIFSRFQIEKQKENIPEIKKDSIDK